MSPDSANKQSSNASRSVAEHQSEKNSSEGLSLPAVFFHASREHVVPFQRKANNTGMSDQLKAGVESLSGMDLSDVKVHYNSSQPAQLNALAYAQGNTIHIGPGQEQHLPHEAWHVVQQRQGRVQATTQMKQGIPVNDDPGLEHEADVMGAKALQMKETPEKKQTGIIHNPIVQGAFTRLQLRNHVDYIKENGVPHHTYAGLDDVSKYMILDKLNEEGIKIPEEAQQLLKEVGTVAEDNSDIDHVGGGAIEITEESPEYEQLVQLKRGPGDSGPKNVNPDTLLPYTQVTYTRDGDGNIDFSSAKSATAWSNPVHGAPIDLSEDSKDKEYGKMLGGSFVHIPSASREQHFSIANRVAKKKGQTAGEGGSSPDNYTWHHLLEKYKMVLVDREVHRKFGHNGGFYFW